LPGGVSGLATCQGQAADGAQVSITGPYPEVSRIFIEVEALRGAGSAAS
jgi:hypothetical protein